MNQLSRAKLIVFIFLALTVIFVVGTACAGEEGTQGPQGPQGAQGPQGSAGPEGPSGPPGERGPQGLAGSAAAVGDQGPAGAQGSAGPQGPAGPPGPPSPPGARGPQGPEGPAGEAISPQANLMLDPSSAEQGTVDLTITGSGFLANEAIILKVLDPNGSEQILGSATANGGGAFQSVQLSASASATGVYTVLAEGVQGSMGSAPLVIAAK